MRAGPPRPASGFAAASLLGLGALWFGHSHHADFHRFHRLSAKDFHLPYHLPDSGFNYTRFKTHDLEALLPPEVEPEDKADPQGANADDAKAAADAGAADPGAAGDPQPDVQLADGEKEPAKEGVDAALPEEDAPAGGGGAAEPAGAGAAEGGGAPGELAETPPAGGGGAGRGAGRGDGGAADRDGSPSVTKVFRFDGAAAGGAAPPAPPPIQPFLKHKGGRCGGACLLSRLNKKGGRMSTAEHKKIWGHGHSVTGETQIDDVVAEDDGSTCTGRCNNRGYCERGKCVCAAAYAGAACQVPRRVGHRMSLEFHQDVTFNARKVKAIGVGRFLEYRSNPKFGERNKGTHAFRIKVTRDMEKILPEADVFAKRVYRSCAIVGSSGVLTKYRLGAEIDAHSAVFRFNRAPTAGYEAVAGKRTSFRLLNTVHAGFREGTEATVQQMQSSTGVNLYQKVLHRVTRHHTYAFDTSFSSHVSKQIGVLPTGGFFGVHLALQRCVEVSLYGFHHREGYGVRYHYFNSERPRSVKGGMAIHDYAGEFRLILALAKAGLLRFGEPCTAGCRHDTGIKYQGPAGSTCACSGNPLPVALPGFCRRRNSFSCFVPCPGGERQCPGTAAYGKNANTAEGECPHAVQKLFDAGELACAERPRARPVETQ